MMPKLQRAFLFFFFFSFSKIDYAIPQIPELSLQAALANITATYPLAPVADINSGEFFSEEELLTVTEQNLKQLADYTNTHKTEGYGKLCELHKSLINELQKYNVSGFSVVSHSSANFIWGHEKFDVNFVFKNNNHEFYARKFELDYTTLGWQSEWVYRTDALFFIGENISRYKAKDPVEFKRGISWSLRIPLSPLNYQLEDNRYRMDFPISQIGMTILPLKNFSTYLVIMHLGIGFTGFFPLPSLLDYKSLVYDFALATNISMVTAGGKLKPYYEPHTLIRADDTSV